MYKGGTIANGHIARIIRLAGLIVPIVLVFYGLFVKEGYADQSHFLNTTLFYGLMLVWVFLGLLFLIYPINDARSSALRLISYHILAACYILFVSGFTASFIAAWVLLFVASYAMFSMTGLKASIVFFFGVAIADVAIHWFDRDILITDITAVVAVTLIGVTVIAINKIQEVDGAELLRSKAQELLQRDRILTIVNNLADAVLSTDKDGVIRVYNAAALNLLDTNSSLNGHHIDDILTLRTGDRKPLHLFKTLKEARGVAIRDDLTFTVEDETLRIELTYSPIHSTYNRASHSEEQDDGYILILRDVTKSKSLEEERDEFISVVSHELRTPITIAEGTISNTLLMMERKGTPVRTLKTNIATAHDQVIFLAKMVNDLSTLSRAERGVADAAEVIDVRNLVDDLYKEYAPQAERKKLRFNLDLSSHLGKVTASQLYLKELLQNFITNSLKYTKEGEITLKVSRKSGKITFEVKDTGIGISKSDQAKVFNKFYRSEDYRTRETGGTGLGLYVAMKLAKKLGTEIELSSRLNHGSSFSITLNVEDEK